MRQATGQLEKVYTKRQELRRRVEEQRRSRGTNGVKIETKQVLKEVGAQLKALKVVNNVRAGEAYYSVNLDEGAAIKPERTLGSPKGQHRKRGGGAVSQCWPMTLMPPPLPAARPAGGSGGRVVATHVAMEVVKLRDVPAQLRQLVGDDGDGAGRVLLVDVGVFCRVRLHMSMPDTQRRWNEVADTRVYKLVPQQQRADGQSGDSGTAGGASGELLHSAMGRDGGAAAQRGVGTFGVNRLLMEVVGVLRELQIDLWREGRQQRAEKGGHITEQPKLLASGTLTLGAEQTLPALLAAGLTVPLEAMRSDPDAPKDAAAPAARKFPAGNVELKSWSSRVRRLDGCYRDFRTKAELRHHKCASLAAAAAAAGATATASATSSATAATTGGRSRFRRGGRGLKRERPRGKVMSRGTRKLMRFFKDDDD